MSDKIAVFDAQTLGLESTSVILSAALLILPIGEDEYTFDDMTNATRFVKFNVDDQVKNYGRQIDKHTLEWWATQDIDIRKMNFKPSKEDQSVIDGLARLFNHNIKYGAKDMPIFVRGMIKQISLDSLCKASGTISPFKFYQWVDIKTYISTIADDADKYGNSKFVDKTRFPDYNIENMRRNDPIHSCISNFVQIISQQG